MPRVGNMIGQKPVILIGTHFENIYLLKYISVTNNIIAQTNKQKLSFK